LYIRGYSVGMKEKRQQEETLHLDWWSCTYAKWVLSQFGNILDKIFDSNRSDNSE